METGAAVEKQKQFFHSSLQNAYWRFAQFPQAWRSQQPRGGPNQMIKVGQIKWTKPAGRCDEKNRLVLEYRTTTESYSTAVSELSRRIGVGSLDDQRKLHEAAEAARARSNEARDRLARHIAEHHCATS